MEKIMGSENELFGVLINYDGEAKGAIFTLPNVSEGYVNLFIAALMHHFEVISSNGATIADCELFDFFTANGFRVYRDVNHLEVATPECAGARDLLKWEKAGERMVARFLKEVNVVIAPQKLFLCKKNCDFGVGAEGHSFGSHESYSARTLEGIEVLLPFFTSSVIFTGSGHVDAGGRYVLSPRGMLTSLVKETSVQQIKAMFKDSSANDNDLIALFDGPQRLQVVFRDSNMADWSVYLKFGTTAFILRMFESGFLRPIKRGQKQIGFCGGRGGDGLIRESEAVKALNLFSGEIGKKRRVSVVLNGEKKEMSALEIQKLYLGWAEEFASSRGASSLEADVLKKWRFVLEALENDEGVLADKLDWKIKETILNRFLARRSPSLNLGNYRAAADAEKLVKRLQLRDLLYHSLDEEERGSARRLAESGALERIITDKEIDFALRFPPPNTRARWRGELIGEISKRRLPLKGVVYNRIEILKRGRELKKELSADDYLLLYYDKLGYDEKIFRHHCEKLAELQPDF